MSIQTKQIAAVLSASIQLTGVASGTGASVNVTSALTTALNTAGNGGVSVPLQPSSGVASVGVIVSGPNKSPRLYSSLTLLNLQDGSGNDLYGRLTQSGGVYTLNFYSLVAGTETAYTFATSTNINFEFNYRFDFARYPADAIILTPTRESGQDPTTVAGATPFAEQLTVTATNTFSNLSYTPKTATAVQLVINQLVYDAVGGSYFGVGGAGNKVVTWNASNPDTLSVSTSDRVIAYYSY